MAENEAPTHPSLLGAHPLLKQRQTPKPLGGPQGRLAAAKDPWRQEHCSICRMEKLTWETHTKAVASGQIPVRLAAHGRILGTGSL